MNNNGFAIITGGARRIGRAIVLKLAENGFDVLIHYNSSENEAHKLAREVKKRFKVNAEIYGCDLLDTDEVKHFFDHVFKNGNGSFVLVNNASLYEESTIESMDFHDFLKMMRINAYSPFELSRQFKKILKKGVIVNILDTRIKSFDRFHAAYFFSKKVLEEMTRVLALEYAPLIRVNGVAPGVILPPPGKDEAYVERLKHTNPLMDRGFPEDVADAVLFLIKSRFITGQVIFVDGGRHLLGVKNG